MTCYREDLERLPSEAEVRACGLRSWGGGRQSAGGSTGLSDPRSLPSRQPCLPRAKFHCPLDFKEEILVQVTGTVELVGEIKVSSCWQQVQWIGGLEGEAAGSPPDGLPTFFFTTRMRSPDPFTAADERHP